MLFVRVTLENQRDCILDLGEWFLDTRRKCRMAGRGGGCDLHRIRSSCSRGLVRPACASASRQRGPGRRLWGWYGAANARPPHQTRAGCGTAGAACQSSFCPSLT